MANGTNMNLLSSELEKLLNDICAFLNEESADKMLTLSRKLKAGLLLKRSHQQLRTLRSINKPAHETHPIMSCSRAVNRSQNLECIYANVSELQDLSNSLFEDRDFPIADEDDGVTLKSGHLSCRKKIFIFEKTTKLFVAIFRHWFIIYANEFASKPLHVINLAKYECSSCVDLPSNFKKKDRSFDIIPADGSKSFRFIATSPKDMQEWVTTIKNSYPNQNPTPVPILTGAKSDYSLENGPISKTPSRAELKENNIPTMKQTPYGYHLHEVPSIGSFSKLDKKKYISVIGSSSIDSFSADENDKLYDTIERVTKRTRI